MYSEHIYALHRVDWAEGYKTCFRLNPAKHEVSSGHKCCIYHIFNGKMPTLVINVKKANNCWHFNIYERDKFHFLLS